MKYCTQCGTQLADTALFCSACGTKQGQPQPGNTATQAQPNQPVQQETLLGAITGTVNSLTGGKKEAVRPPLGKIFGQTFKSHSQEDAETIFACGTPTTTPKLTSAETAWPQPWLWSRVLLGLGIAFLMLMLCCEIFGNINALPGTIILGSFMVPVAVMVFFFELNTPKNVSFYNVLKIFLVGGCASLLFTLFLFSVVEVEEMDYIGAILVGIVEEVGKAGIVAYFIFRETKDAKYNVNGLLIGAAVGAGFAAFESAGYALNYFLEGGYDLMMDVIFLRAFLAPGGHVVWAAMSGYAMMLVKGDGPMSMQVFGKANFWKIFWIPVVLHAIWDMPLLTDVEVPLVQIALCVASWIVIFVIINNCLTQLAQVVSKEAAEEETAEPEPVPAAEAAE